MRAGRYTVGAIAALAALIVAGCGGDDGGGTTTGATTAAPTTAATTTSTTTTGAAGEGKTTITMTDFAFSPDKVTLTQGDNTIIGPNKGKTPHELVVAKTALAPNALPTDSSGDVVEGKLDVVGEIADVDPGKTKHTDFDLEPGKYVMFCNVPGHYKAGMYGTITVQ